MTDSMKFGPEWLRNLSQDGCAQPVTPSAPRYQLADHRYGREEMLALFDHMVKAPDRLASISSLYVEKTQEPLALQQMTEDETRMWNRGINSDAVLRLSGKVSSGTTGGPRGRGGSVDRGRGRGRGSYHYSRGLSYEELGDGVDLRGGLRGGLDRDRVEGTISSATSFPRNIRPFDRSQGSLTDRGWNERNGDTGDWNGSTSPRKEFGGGRGFITDNWRRHRGGGEDEDGWRTATSSRSDKWGRGSSWREGDKDGSEAERERNVTGRGQGWERGRSWDEPGPGAPTHHPHRRPWDEDNLPEWVNENPSESGGSFDASGAFHGGGGYSDEDEDGVTSAGGGNHSREPRSKLLSDSSGTKWVTPGMSGSSRRVPGTTGNSSSTDDRAEGGRRLDSDQATVDTQQQSAEELASSVVTLANSSQTSKGPSKPLTTDTSTRQSSSTKTSPPASSQSTVSSSDSRPSGPALTAKNTSVSSDSAAVLQHRSSAVTNSGKLDSITNSGFAGSSACVNEVISNNSDSITSVGPTVTSAELNGGARDTGAGANIDTDRSSHTRPQTLAVGRQKSEDDMEHMQEVADDLVAKLMDDEEGQDKLMASAAEKWYYRDPQGEVQGPFLSGEMADWFRAGYFTLNLLVKRSCDDRYSQLGDLIKIWGRIPFMPGPTFPPVKGGDAVSTSVPTPGQSTLTQGVTTPTIPTGLEQENLLMQHYHYQLLQRQLLLGQQAVTRKLSQTEHWNTLTPVEQQQLIMQQMLSQPISQQPMEPFLQQMAAPTHKNPVMHLLSQLHQPQVPTTSVPDSQHPPAQTPTPVLEPLQQLIQQMGGLQQLPSNTGHQSRLHPQSLSASDTAASKPEDNSNAIQMLIRQLGNKATNPQLESVWGGNVSPSPTSPAAVAAAAAAAAAFTAHSWLGQIPAAPPGQLPPSSLWGLHGKDVKTEQQVVEEQMRAEEERRRDELRKQEETQRRTEEEEKRKQLEEELRKKEAEKQRLEEQMQKLEEERKQEERRRKEEERQRLEEKRHLEEKLRQEEEQKRKLAEEAAERKRQQEEARRLEEEAAARKREEAARRKEEEKKRKEEEKEKKRKIEEERKQEEEERRRLEEEMARKKQQQDEEERRLEQQRRQTEALRRLQEQQQRAKSAPWSQQTPGTGSSLVDIQRQEKEKKEREQQQLIFQLQQQQSQQSQLHMQSLANDSSGSGNNIRGSSSLQLKWADRKPLPANKVKSLAEIQAEEQEQLAKQQERERAERAQQQKEVSLAPPSGIWGAASHSLSWTSSGSNAASVWGSTTPATTVVGGGGFWDDVAQNAPKPSGKPVGGKAKPSTATSGTGNNPSGKATASKTRSKKEEALVMKLFEQNVSRGDEFTQWCNKALSGLQSSVDIPTFVGFLRDIESPYEVKDYVRLYLGEGKEVQEFARQFLERRSKWRSAQRAAPLEDDMCVPAPAVNPLTTDFQEVKGKGKKAKRSKMFRVDNRILGFSVTAAQDRINVGDRDYVEGL